MKQFTILFGHLDADTLELVWDDCGTGTYKSEEDATWFAEQYRQDGQIYKIVAGE